LLEILAIHRRSVIAPPHYEVRLYRQDEAVGRGIAGISVFRGGIPLSKRANQKLFQPLSSVKAALLAADHQTARIRRCTARSFHNSNIFSRKLERDLNPMYYEKIAIWSPDAKVPYQWM
jgi:hypothetical protein